MTVNITGAVILTGNTEWEAGSKIEGQEILALPVGDDSSKPLAPVPYPPPTGLPFSQCTSTPPTGQKMKLLVNPNASGHTVGGDPMVTINSMFLQGTTSFPTCQPIMGIATTPVIATLPVMTKTNRSSSMGFMNGAGGQP